MASTPSLPTGGVSHPIDIASLPTGAAAFYPKIATLLSSGKYSDLTIKCKGGGKWKVHRAIVCLQSKPFAAALDSPLAGTLDLGDEECDVVDCLVHFLYSADYSVHRRAIDPMDISDDTPLIQDMNFTYNPGLLLHTKVYIVAEKYDVLSLKELAASKFSAALLREGKTSLFADSLKLLYNKVPESDMFLKDIAMKFAGANYKVSNFSFVSFSSDISLFTIFAPRLFYDCYQLVLTIDSSSRICFSRRISRTCAWEMAISRWTL